MRNSLDSLLLDSTRICKCVGSRVCGACERRGEMMAAANEETTVVTRERTDGEVVAEGLLLQRSDDCELICTLELAVFVSVRDSFTPKDLWLLLEG